MGVRITAVLVLVLCALCPASSVVVAVAGSTSVLADEASQKREKEAFESAKELGTADAWNAFLAAYPSGFYADLARAYLKKGGEPQPPPGLAPSSARAAERPCSDRKRLRSEKSSEPTKITFVNKSGMYRGIMWLDFDGRPQDYGGVNSGDQVSFETFRSHPWMIVTGPGDCLQIFLPSAEPSIVELARLEADGPRKAAPERAEKRPEKAAPVTKTITCAKNYALQNGKCVLLQNCGANAVRSPEGDCYCKTGYQMRNGACVWPQDKKGFEIAPWKKPGCKTWQQQCSQGSAKACKQFEETCQVN